jgi:hypothetical protein
MAVDSCPSIAPWSLCLSGQLADVLPCHCRHEEASHFSSVSGKSIKSLLIVVESFGGQTIDLDWRECEAELLLNE